MSAIDKAKLVEIQARDHFEARLRSFVEMWAPKDDRYDRDTFQRELLMLFRDAMTSQRATFSSGVELYASLMLENRSTQALHAIFEEPKR